MLRPQFTQTLVETLKKQSVNVYGDAGQGQARLVADVSHAMQQDGWLVLTLDMNSWKENYAGMVENLYAQVHLALPASPKSTKDFGTLLASLDKHSAQTPVLLLMDHFDALLDNTLHLDTNYKNFFNHINSLRNQAQRAILVLTPKPYGNYSFYTKDDIRSTSMLDLDCKQWRKLSHEEVKAEIQRHAPPLDKQSLGQLNLAVYNHPRPLAFLAHCLEQLTLGHDQEQPFAKRLKLWKVNFEHHHKKIWRRKLDCLQNGLTIAKRELGNLSLKVKLLLGTILALGASLTLFFDKTRTLLQAMGGWFK
jgi:hypothetical protein